MKSEMTAFILSGGKSSRMSTNKSFLEFNNEPLIQRLTNLFDQIFSTVVISSNEPGLYKFLGMDVVEDIFPDRGPLSGIHSALSFAGTERNFIISCDLPFINGELINYLCKYESDSDIILPKAEGRIQHLFGVYSKKILPIVETILNESQKESSKLKGSIYELLEQVNNEIIDVTDLKFYHPDLFFNINSPEDYRYAIKILEGNQK